MAAEIQAPQPVVENLTKAEEIKLDFTSATTVKTYIELKAMEKGVDPKLALRIAKCESNFVPQQSKHIRKDGTREKSFGVWQIHLPAHPEITKQQAMDVEWSTDWALNQMKKGNAKIWSCYRL